MIIQHLYYPDIINSIRGEVSNHGTSQRTKLPNKEYGTLPSKLAEEIPWNKLFVDLIGPYVIIIMGKK